MAELIRRSDVEPRLTRWDPFEEMRDLASWEPFQQLDTVFTTPGSLGRAFSPSFEVRETPDAYVFRADLPGVKQPDVEITLTGNRLTIRGKREQEQSQEGDRFFAFECSYGSFSRTFTVPEGADLDNVQAEMKNGVLTVVVPKSGQAKPRRISLKSLTETVKEGVKEIKEKVSGLKEKVAEKLQS